MVRVLVCHQFTGQNFISSLSEEQILAVSITQNLLFMSTSAGRIVVYNDNFVICSEFQTVSESCELYCSLGTYSSRHFGYLKLISKLE